MSRVPVVSSNIASVGYEAEGATLEIEFLSGSVYQYYGVPEDLHSGLMFATSHGSYFNEHIKGRFGDTKVG